MLSTNEVGEMLGIHPNTVRNMLKDGRLKAIKTRGGSGQYRFRESDVQAYLEDGALLAAPTVSETPPQRKQTGVEFLEDCGNPFYVFGSFLETQSAENYSKQLAGKAALWVEETLRQASLQFDSAALTDSREKVAFLTSLGVGIAAKKDQTGRWLLTSLLAYMDEQGTITLLDGTLQQFHPELEKGVVIIEWDEQKRYYTDLEIINQETFQDAINGKNTYFQEFIRKIRLKYPFK